MAHLADPGLRTERLVLRRWRSDDVGALAAMDADLEVMRFIGDGSIRRPDEAPATLARLERAWDELGFGLFAVETEAPVGTDAPAEFVGWVGLSVPRFLPEVLPAVEIGWRLARPQWGRGYATEAARAVLRFAFEKINLERIISIIHPANEASLGIVAKLGLHLDRETLVPAHGRPVQVWAIERAGWTAAH